MSDVVLFVMMSKGFVDALLKKFSGKFIRGGGLIIEEYGVEKLNRYLFFLDFLIESGVWSEINVEECLEILMYGEMIVVFL